MPLYEYECTKCGRRCERIEKVAGPHLKKCPDCGGAVERLLAPPAIQFKGSGWYVTDYASKSSGDTHKSEKPEAKDGKEKKTEAKEAKPAKKEK